MPSPHTTPQHDTQDALCSAALAVGTLAEAVRRSPLQGAWRLRETAHVAAARTSRRFGPVSAEHLFAIVAGAPSIRAFASEELMIALTFWRDGLNCWFQTSLPSPWGAPFADGQREDDGALLGDLQLNTGTDERSAHASPNSGVEPTLLRLKGPTSGSFAAIIMNAPAAAKDDQGFGHLELALPLALASDRAAGAILPALALGVAQTPGRLASPDQFAMRIEREARSAQRRLQTLELAWTAWQHRIPERRADSRLDDVVRLLTITPLLTPAQVARRLGVTRKAGAAHLNALTAAGIAREVTGRARWRLFCAQDLAMPPWRTQPSQHRSRIRTAAPPEPGAWRPDDAPHTALGAAQTHRRPVDHDAFDCMLGDAYGGVDAAIARVSALLST